MTAKLLADTSRLQEIYNLRVIAWENSGRGQVINRRNHPNGWSESIDIDAFHFVIEDSGRIVASARLSLHNYIDELPYPDAFTGFLLPEGRPFAFYSRLVVEPKYRQYLLYKKLDAVRLAFLIKHRIPFALATCQEARIASLVALGFEILGPTRINYGEMVLETALLLKHEKYEQIHGL